MHFLFFLPLSLLLPLVHSSPIQHGASFRITLRRQSSPKANVSTSTQDIGNVTTFDPSYALRERKKVTSKYADAQNVLRGVGLPGQETHPEAGYPKFEAPTSPGLGNATVLTGTPPVAPAMFHELTDPSDEGPNIIGVPPVAPGTAQMPLRDYIVGALDVLYYGPMQFGSPPQELTVDIDTGSADLWVPVNCQDCANEQFYSRRSSTYKGSTSRCSITYGSGKVYGTLAQDIVSVGAVSVPKQAFCAVRKESEDLNDEPNSGLLGLAFGRIAQSGKPTFFENLLEEKKLAASIFSVHLSRTKATGSEVCFGCFDATKAMGPVRWNPVISRTYWSIAMDGLSVNKTRSISANLTAAVDTGTTLIYLPDTVAQSFYALIPGSATAMQYGAGFYTFPCDTTMSVALILSGQSFSIYPSDFNLGRTDADSDDCVGGILALGNGFPSNLAIVGDEFLKSWYSVFDYAGRVGFARSVNNE